MLLLQSIYASIYKIAVQDMASSTQITLLDVKDSGPIVFDFACCSIMKFPALKLLERSKTLFLHIIQ